MGLMARGSYEENVKIFGLFPKIIKQNICGSIDNNANCHDSYLHTLKVYH